MSKLLVSVRGYKEAIEAVLGGAHIADVEFPGSALGTPYPLNINAVRNKLNELGYNTIFVSTNIGEKQTARSTACQAALGVALAGADYVKLGFAGFNLEEASYLGNSIVRTVKKWFSEKKVYPAVFPENEYKLKFNPLIDGPKLVEKIDCDGLLIDTYDKEMGKGLMDYYTIDELKKFVTDLHNLGKEAWLAGSLTLKDLPDLWEIGTDVICVRGAACDKSKVQDRFGEVKSEIVKKLVNTIP